MYIYVVQVAYATALDVFIIICSILVFFALAEFALLSFLDVYIRKDKPLKVCRGSANYFQGEIISPKLLRMMQEE